MMLLACTKMSAPPSSGLMNPNPQCSSQAQRSLSIPGRNHPPRSEWPEIPAETPYSESYRKRAVCEDWMVEALGHKLVTHHPVIEPVSDIRVGNGNLRCRDGHAKAGFVSRITLASLWRA